jgi:dihydrofolate synthase/folylpolyglutamate synthase
MIDALRPQVDEVIYATPPMPRAAPAELLAALRPGTIASDPRQALALAERAAGHDGLVIAAGSIFLIAEIRAARLGLRADPPIGM